MDLPFEARAALDRLLEGTRAGTLADIARRQSDAYRHRADHGLASLLIQSDADALAYASWRLPATFGAARAVLSEVARLVPSFMPRRHLDLGAGPGTAVLATRTVFDTLDTLVALEGADSFRALGDRLFDALTDEGQVRPRFRAADLAEVGSIDRALEGATGAFDLVTLCYVSGEIAEPARARLVDAAWARTAGVLVVVEPGTTAGHARLLEMRERLTAVGGHVVGPCPHAAACPLKPPDWCHFAVRVARSRTHRRVKGAELGFEDEKYAWLAVATTPTTGGGARLLRPTHIDKAAVELQVCASDGEARTLAVPRRAKAAYKAAKKLRWGDAIAPEILDEARDVTPRASSTRPA